MTSYIIDYSNYYVTITINKYLIDSNNVCQYLDEYKIDNETKQILLDNNNLYNIKIYLKSKNNNHYHELNFSHKGKLLTYFYSGNGIESMPNLDYLKIKHEIINDNIYLNIISDITTDSIYNLVNINIDTSLFINTLKNIIFKDNSISFYDLYKKNIKL